MDFDLLSSNNVHPERLILLYSSTHSQLHSKPKHRKLTNGYSISRLPDPAPAEFICGECQNLVKKPMECSPCGKLYCEYCVLHIKKNNERQFQCKVCKSAKDPRSPSLLVKKLIGEVKITCFNYEKGCLSIVDIDGLTKHENSCPYREVVCENHNFCKNKGLLKDFYETESLFPGIQFALVVQELHRHKSFVCSERCKKVLEFHKMALNKKVDRALEDYFGILKQATKSLENR